MSTGRSYWQQAIRKRERAAAFVKAAGFVVLTAWLYYRSFWAVPALCPLLVWKYRSREAEYLRKKRSAFLLQFKEMIQDMVVSAVNEALRQAEDAMNKGMEGLTKGLNIPGLGL